MAREPRGQVTLKKIAERLGVSRTTVSNAYSRPDQLTPELRERILATARELGYAGPNAAVRTLRRGRSNAYGVILTELLSYAFTDPAAVLFFQGVAQASEQAGISLLLLPAPSDRLADPASVQEAVVDGFLLYSVNDNDPRIDAVLRRGLPTVIIDQPERPGAGFVGIDDYAGARMATEHMLALGHRRFAVVSLPLAQDGDSGSVSPERLAAATFPVTQARLRGYADTLRAAGIDWERVPVEEAGANSRPAGARAAAAILDRSPRPTAILAASDQLATGVVDAVAVRGLQVPRDLSVAGFDDAPVAAAARPSITTVRQPLLEKGRVAARMLLDGWSVGEPPRIMLPVELIMRASTGPAPA